MVATFDLATWRSGEFTVAVARPHPSKSQAPQFVVLFDELRGDVLFRLPFVVRRAETFILY